MPARLEVEDEVSFSTCNLISLQYVTGKTHIPLRRKGLRDRR